MIATTRRAVRLSRNRTLRNPFKCRKIDHGTVVHKIEI